MPFFKDSYLDLFRGVREERSPYASGKKRINERFVKCLWMEQPFRDTMSTLDGIPFKILSPGQWNLEPGPDFRNALISFDGKKALRGDVEIHLHAKDWKRHGHGKNPNFDKTILHAFLWNDVKKPDDSLSQFEISRFLKQDLEVLHDRIEPESYPFNTARSLGQCHATIREIGIPKTMEIIGTAADVRILQKAERFGSASGREEWNRLLYERVMEALGYKKNRQPFLLLALKVPFKKLTRVLKQTDPSQRMDTAAAILFGAACLLPTPEEEAIHQESGGYFKKLKMLWEDKSSLFTGPPITWNLGVCRPANFPHRRIAGLCGMIVTLGDEGLMDFFFRLFDSLTLPFHWRDVFDPFKALFESEPPFWPHYYVYRGKRLSPPKKLIGKERLKTIIINVVIPVLLAYSRSTGDLDLEEKLHSLFSFMPSAEPNSITRYMEYTLVGDLRTLAGCRSRGEMTVWKRNAKIEQGLMRIFADFCADAAPGCVECLFPDILTKSEKREYD